MSAGWAAKRVGDLGVDVGQLLGSRCAEEQIGRTGTLGEELGAGSIRDVLAEFLEVERERLSERTYADYESVISLLESALDGYAYQNLDDSDRERFHRGYDAEGDAHREFTEMFGPEHIVTYLDEFLGYFVIRKVIAGESFTRQCATVTRRLSKWLGERGYVGSDEAQVATDRAKRAARDLPTAEKLVKLLEGDGRALGLKHRPEVVHEGYFEISDVGEASLEAFHLESRGKFSIRVSPEAARLCRTDWTVSGAVARITGDDIFIEVWNVYPGLSYSGGEVDMPSPARPYR